MWCIGTQKSNEVEIIREHVQHLIKLRTIKPRVDTNPPKPLLNPKTHKKSSSCTLLKSNSIQQENQILLKKMYEIDSRQSILAKTCQNPSFKSLNRNSRIKTLTKISQENQNLLTRLQHTKSSYSLKTWEKDHQFKSYLKHKLSQNSRHMAKVSSMSSSNLPSNTRVHTSQDQVSRMNTSQKYFRSYL